MGYLDLVLNVRDSPLGDSSIWVEVKVDAGPSGDQLEVYKQHAALLQTPPAIITLARTKVIDGVPFLKWSDVVAAIDEIPAVHHAWLSLREFLLDERIVRPPVPPKPVNNADAYIEVILDVNRRLRQLWPKTTLFWMDGALRRSLKISFEAHHDLVTSGGPLRYGLMPAGNGWDWGLVVTARKSVYQKVALDVQQMVRDADVGGLPQDWARHSDDRFEVLERRVSAETFGAHDEIVAWFGEGLHQLRDAKVLDQYFAGLTTGQDTVVESAQLPEEDGEDG